MYLCGLGAKFYSVMFGVGIISFISLWHISLKENVCVPIYFMAAESKGDLRDLGSSGNWCKDLEDMKFRWPRLALKSFH